MRVVPSVAAVTVMTSPVSKVTSRVEPACTASLMVAVTLMTSLSLKVPSAVEEAKLASVGAVVSITKSWLSAKFWPAGMVTLVILLPARSVMLALAVLLTGKSVLLGGRRTV